jgi:hypothetical protein
MHQRRLKRNCSECKKKVFVLSKPFWHDFSEWSLIVFSRRNPSKLTTVCHQRLAAQAAASNSNLRWLHVPDLTLLLDKFLSLGGRSEEIS